MSRIAMSEVTTYRWSFEEDVQYYQAARFEAIGVWRRKLSDFGEERAAELLRESGLSVSSLSWAGGFTGGEGHAAAESVTDALCAIEQAAEIEAGCLVIYSGGRNHHIRTHALRLLRAALDRLLPVAECCGVTLALEPLHPMCAEGWTFLTSPREALAVVREYESPWLKMAFDTYHFPHLSSLGLPVAELAEHTALVQVGDARAPHGVDQDRCLLGQGGVPLAQLLHEFVEAGYTGDFEVKLMGPSIEHLPYRELLRNARETLLDVLATSPDRV